MIISPILASHDAETLETRNRSRMVLCTLSLFGIFGLVNTSPLCQVWAKKNNY